MSVSFSYASFQVDSDGRCFFYSELPASLEDLMDVKPSFFLSFTDLPDESVSASPMRFSEVSEELHLSRTVPADG